ncbi:MAG: alpha/beta hydrolase [Proteobacteria bacterium]|nr:alpha/beta hydrolase [Pseudomonadota bacterium]
MRLVRMLALSSLLSSAAAFADNSPSTHIYKTVDGHNILVDVFTPDEGSQHPAIIFIHAGGLIQGSRQWILPWQRQMYVAAGFVLASIDHRLAPETKLEDIQSDVEDAYHWLRTEGPQRFDIDANKISIVGHSAGGYLALSSGFRLTPRPRAIVSFYGYGDITGAWYTEPNADFIEEEPILANTAHESVGSVEDIQENLGHPISGDRLHPVPASSHTHLGSNLNAGCPEYLSLNLL